MNDIDGDESADCQVLSILSPDLSNNFKTSIVWKSYYMKSFHHITNLQ